MNPTNIRDRNWMLTINNYTDTDCTAISDLRNCNWIYQPERGEKEGTAHLQVALMFKNARTFSSIKKKFPTAHIEVARNKYACINYCRKQETSIGDPISNFNTDEYFKTRGKPRDYFKNKIPYGWQREIIRLIKTEPDERKVYWYWEPKGCRGKTALARNICLNYNAIQVGGNARDIKCGITKWLEINDKEWLDVVIINLTFGNMHISYSAMEQIKDGIFFSGKYESGMVIFNIPHLIVFANCEPEYHMLSEDRWVVREIK